MKGLIYQAGNSPLELQVYLPKTQGVGLATMREFCKQTARKLAQNPEMKLVMQSLPSNPHSMNYQINLVRKIK